MQKDIGEIKQRETRRNYTKRVETHGILFFELFKVAAIKNRSMLVMDNNFIIHFNIRIKNLYKVNIQNIIVNNTTHSLLI